MAETCIGLEVYWKWSGVTNAPVSEAHSISGTSHYPFRRSNFVTETTQSTLSCVCGSITISTVTTFSNHSPSSCNMATILDASCWLLIPLIDIMDYCNSLVWVEMSLKRVEHFFNEHTYVRSDPNGWAFRISVQIWQDLRACDAVGLLYDCMMTWLQAQRQYVQQQGRKQWFSRSTAYSSAYWCGTNFFLLIQGLNDIICFV